MFFQPDLLHSRAQTITQVLLGAIGLTWYGPAALTLSANNTFTGVVIGNNGTLKAGIAGTPFGAGPAAGSPAFGSGSDVTLNNSAVLDLNGFAVTLGKFTGGASATVLLGANTLTLNGNPLTSTFAGIISGTGGITKLTTNTQTLNGANTYTGPNTLTLGILSIAVLANGGTASGIGASTNAASNLLMDGGTLTYNSANAAATDRNFTITAAKTFGIRVSNAAAVVTWSGASTATTGALSMSVGTGTLIMSGANLHTGLTSVSAGTLRYGASNVFSGSVQTSGTGTLDIGAFSDTVTGIALAGGTITGTTGILTSTTNITSNFASPTVGSNSAILAGAGIQFTKSGTGILTMTGVSSFNGTFNCNGGTVIFNSIGNVNTSSALGQGSVTASGASTLQYVGSGHSTNRTLALSGTGSTLDASGSGTLTWANLISFSAAAVPLIVSGTGIGIISTGISSGTNGVVTKNGSGTWTFSGMNNYTGATTVNAGTLLINGSIAAGSAITVNSGILGGTGTLNSAPTVANTVGAYIMGGLGANDVGTLTVAAGVTFAGANSGWLVNTNGTNAVSILSRPAASQSNNFNGCRVDFGAGQNLDTAQHAIFNGGALSTVSNLPNAGTAPANRSSFTFQTGVSGFVPLYITAA